jgi:hypothetical protein
MAAGTLTALADGFSKHRPEQWGSIKPQSRLAHLPG